MNISKAIIISSALISLSILIKQLSANNIYNNETISSYGYSFSNKNGTTLNRYGFFHIRGDRVRNCYEHESKIQCGNWNRVN